MSNAKGCKFCRRYGLPVLPVRPAVMEKGDRLPTLPGSITVPVAAEGEADYTARLMRQGYLYILAERSQRWMNYYATGDGYFYPLPEDGSVPPRVESGEMKPCITQPAELATASLVTLPVKPPGMLNGVYWFAWSEEQWTPAVRRQHEEATFRRRYMQPFDMDAWLARHSGQQALPFSQLSSVAEYSPGLSRSTLKHWTPSPLRAVSRHSATDLQQAAESLSAGNGAILVLSDPVGVATEISALARYRMQQAIATNPALSRGIALQTMLGSVELAMRNHFYLSAETGDAHFEQQMRYGWDSPAGPHFPAPAVADRMHALNDVSRDDRVDEAWQSGYEKYIDRTQEQAFSQTLEDWLTAYDNSSVIPVTRMYLAWLQGPAMADYFVQHFDPTCAHSGGRYIQTVAKVLAGMSDKGGVITHIDQQLNQAALTPENFLQRAAFFNHDGWIAQVDAQLKTGGPDWWLGMSWDRLADGAKGYSGNYAGAILTGLEKLSLLWSEAMMKSVDLMVKGTPVRFAIGMLAMQGKAFSAVSVMPGTKNFVGAMTRGMAGMLEMSGKSGGQLYTAMRKLAERLVKELPESAGGQIQLPRILDVAAAKALAALPVKERLAKLSTVMLTEDELARMLFPTSLNASVAKLSGMKPGTLATEMAAKGMTFGGTVFSAYFQWMVLSYGLKNSGLPVEGKAATVFGANAGMAVASTAEALKLAMTPLMRLELPSVISLVRNGAMRVVGAGIWGWTGYSGGVIYSGIEFWNGLSDAFEGKVGTGLGHLINSAGVGMMTVGGGSRISVALLTSLFGVSRATLAGSQLAAFLLGPAGIFVGMLLALGAGAWLLIHSRNNIQSWLLSTQWRRVPPGESDIPAIYPDARMEKDGYMALTAQGAAHV
ncbi:T6SS effector BTH_I2691 family protein [Winslowiella toletana]|uniref:T6SS effector BTH_I2691 family protein n=1 Tax=Winslowiella toletana TaxID=92490 RepID=UPI0028BE7CFA|nr:T6SS effector BTH_I2691 family protein [Winslowiella toletana]WNN45657.1 T6SS effector BTH_I2691 family protein [Winslowiella toletana]